MTDRHSEILAIIKDTRTLPSLPGIITKLNSLSENEKSSVEQMAKVVASDQMLSARVLRLVNSPSYGFYKVSTISNAMILLGVSVVKSLALSSSIFEIMEEHTVGLWEHSLGTAVAANVIARRLALPECEEIATSALLHDIGKVIIKINFKEEYEQVLALAASSGAAVRDAEIEILGIDHAAVGNLLIKYWNLPDKLIEPVSNHHDVARSELHRAKTAVVHLADVLIKASGFGFSGSETVPRIQTVAWEELGMDDEILGDVVSELEDRLIEVRNFSLEIQSKNETSA
jgi:putative nucleotidyltransferase with HDIG domain